MPALIMHTLLQRFLLILETGSVTHTHTHTHTHTLPFFAADSQLHSQPHCIWCRICWIYIFFFSTRPNPHHAHGSSLLYLARVIWNSCWPSFLPAPAKRSMVCYVDKIKQAPMMFYLSWYFFFHLKTLVYGGLCDCVCLKNIMLEKMLSADGIDLFYKVVRYECCVLSRSFKLEVNSRLIQYNAAYILFWGAI